MSHRPCLPFSNFCVQLRFFLFLIHFLSQKPEHCLIVFRYVRETAAGAVLEYPTLLIFTEDRIARTVRIRIHRTIAEQAVKVSALHARMAGEIFAVSVLKKTLAVSYPAFPQIVCSFYFFHMVYHLCIFHSLLPFRHTFRAHRISTYIDMVPHD